MPGFEPMQLSRIFNISARSTHGPLINVLGCRS